MATTPLSSAKVEANGKCPVCHESTFCRPYLGQQTAKHLFVVCPDEKLTAKRSTHDKLVNSSSEGVFKCAKEDDERRSSSVKSSSLGMLPCTPKKYSRILKRQSLGMPPCIPFSIKIHQIVLLHAIFLSLHMLCAMIGASRSLLFSLFSYVCCS